MCNEKGYIYILTNPAFPQYVKIGYAKNVEERLKQLNQSEGVPLAFRIYATYEVDKSVVDKKIHKIIDKLNPTLRSRDEIDGKLRVREFFAMSAEDAYSIFEAMSEIHGCENNLTKYKVTDIQREEEILAQEVIAEDVIEKNKKRAEAFSFSKCDIPIGAVLNFWRTATQPTDYTCVVIDNKNVEFEGQKYSLSKLAAKLSDVKYSVHGPCYFKYNGEWINDIRDRKGF